MRASILRWDHRLTARLRIAERPGILRSLAAVVAHSGDSWFWGAGLILLWRFGSPAWQWRARLFLIGIIVTAILVFIIKLSVKRRRPEGQWGNIYRSTDPHSFPSGHAARAVMLAVVAVGLGPIPLAVAISIWAPLVALARVAMGVHYFSDVLAGAALGAAVGLPLVIRLGMGSG